MTLITYNYKNKTGLSWWQLHKEFPNVSFPSEDVVSGISLFDLGITRVVTEETLEELKDRKITELKSTRDTLEVAPITTDKGVFDFDTKARDRLDIALKALTASGGTIAWTLADNTQVDVTSSDINNVFLAAATRSNELHVKYRELKEKVLACTKSSEVNKISF